MKKITKWGSIASIVGVVLAVAGFLSANADNEFDNNIDSNSGNVINQGNGSVVIYNSAANSANTKYSKTVSTDEGAGAMLMQEPKFDAFLSLNKNPLQIGRLLNGTEIKVINCGDFPASEKLSLQISWCKVEVGEGDFSATIGWLPTKNILKL